MLDYKLLAALVAVVECGGFERAAQILAISQSAVSQRIKLLEARVGAPVLIRGGAPRPTPVGQRLMNHAQQVRLLERDLQRDVPLAGEGAAQARLRIALNADSLATWWAEAVAAVCEENDLVLELLVDDQDVALKRMRAGEVVGCLCATPEPVAGARSLLLGEMEYLAVATPGYIGRYFPQGAWPVGVETAPAVVFGPDDKLQHSFLQAQGVAPHFHYHLCPSSEGFVRLLLAGLGWGMVPALQVQEELASGRLEELVPEQRVRVPLYWHYWRSGGRLLERLTAGLARQAPRYLQGG